MADPRGEPGAKALEVRAAGGRAVHAWECNVRGKNWQRTINHWTAAKARYAYLLDLRDAWPGATFADVTVRRIGPAHTSRDFAQTATSRGLPALQCGQRVVVHTPRGQAAGTLVGSNASANFDVLFDEDGLFKGATLNVHPGEMRLACDPEERHRAAL